MPSQRQGDSAYNLRERNPPVTAVTSPFRKRGLGIGCVKFPRSIIKKEENNNHEKNIYIFANYTEYGFVISLF